MHKTGGVRDPALAFPLGRRRDDVGDRRQADRAVAVSAVGLGLTGLAELLIALLTGSVGLLGDAIHNLSDVSTSAVVFLGFRMSRRPPTERYPYGLERAEDLAGVGIAVVIWASAAFAAAERVEIEGWVSPELSTRDADAVGRQVASAVGRDLPEAGSLVWISRAATDDPLPDCEIGRRGRRQADGAPRPE